MPAEPYAEEWKRFAVALRHLCCQFLLSIDGTSPKRAPLWLGHPDNLICLDPGEMLIYGGNVCHGVHSNLTDQTRISLLWSMGPYIVRPMQVELFDWYSWPPDERWEIFSKEI